MAIKDIDKGFKRIKKEILKEAKKPFVKIGIQGSDATEQKKDAPSGITVVQIGTFHEFGYGVPERSFLRATIDINRRLYRDIAIELEHEIIKGSINTNKALSTLGQKILKDVIKRINSRIPPPLAKETVKRKTVAGKIGDIPLVDTGQLRQSITYVVEA